MSRYEKEDEIIKQRGEPVLRFKPQGNFTEKERLQDDIPDECMVFRINHSSEYMVFAKYNDWVCNHGERWVIRELLSRISA